MMIVVKLIKHDPADCCGACAHFLYEDACGSGYCDKRGCGGWCKYYRNKNKTGRYD